MSLNILWEFIPFGILGPYEKRKRKEGDLNPRRVAPCLISNQVPSTSRPSFRIFVYVIVLVLFSQEAAIYYSSA